MLSLYQASSTKLLRPLAQYAMPSRGIRQVPDTILNQLKDAGIKPRLLANGQHRPFIVYQPTVPDLYALGVSSPIHHGKPVDALDTTVSDMGALVAYSGEKTGRTPKDKRIVREETTEDDIWWGDVNIPLEESSFEINRSRALDYINTRHRIYVFDGFAGWDPRYQLKVRVISTRAYHSLFMNNMLIRPTVEERQQFLASPPDFHIFNSGEFPADPANEGVTSTTSVALNLKKKEAVILGTQYAGEMKKGIFTLMHYLMPKQGVLSLHSSCNEGVNGDVTLLFGLSGTGKTTLSADPQRKLIGDDEHCWTDTGVFNIEGGCYAKCNNLSAESEPDIYNAIKFGSVLENVCFTESGSGRVDFDDLSITENTRLSYPIEAMPNAKIPCVGGHPKNIIFLTCDAFGVLPPVSKLTKEQAMYHFIAGYTAKVAGTEEGVTEPSATFSACFGEAFLMLHPTEYADMLAEKMNQHDADAWLINTGWTGGGVGVGNRMSLPHTRAIIDAIHSGELSEANTTTMDVFGLEVPTACSNVPYEVLQPKLAWEDTEAFESTVNKLAKMFNDAFKKYEDRASPAVIAAGPQL